MEWSADANHGRTIYWLKGMAGTGKSTIARTVARTLAKQQRLAANFFFSRGRGDLSHTGKLFSTIAIQLAATSQGLKRYICDAIAENENVHRQSMRFQWEKLICQPISRLGSDPPLPRVSVFIFDALDECKPLEDIQTLLHLLAETKLSVAFRVLITSRPDLPIRLRFHAIPKNTHEDFVLHDITPTTIKHDIAVFYRNQIREIRNERLLPNDWPGEEKLKLLVERSCGLLIYAATVCRFISDRRWSPVRRLDIVLKGENGEQTPEARLDQMYTQILRSSVYGDCNDQEKYFLSRRFQDSMGTIIVLFDPLSITALKALLLESGEKIDVTLLNSLKSLLDVPDDQDAPILLLHLSFRDFLLDPYRFGHTDFWIDPKKAHDNVAEHCLHLMSSALRRNICQLETTHTSRREIKNSVLERHLPSQLRYACQYWIRHVNEGRLSVHTIRQIEVFLRTHFLHWLEALSLTGNTPLAFPLVDMLKSDVRVGTV